MTFLSPGMKLAKLEKVFVVGGRIVITEVPQELVTILGSCVSVCLWDRKTRMGAMSHFLLPETVNDARSLDGGVSSTRMLIQAMIQKFAVIKNLEAKIYGGSNRFFTNESFLNVGQQNVVAAKFALDEAKISIVDEDTGGKPGRKIYFNTQTGIVRVEMINYEGDEAAVIKTPSTSLAPPMHRGLKTRHSPLNKGEN